MQSMYALAELQWPEQLQQNLAEGRLCTPAEFENDKDEAWSLFVWLNHAALPGERVVVPVMPLISEAAESLLKPDTQFKLFLEKDILVLGRVLQTVKASPEELKCVFHFC